jgi:hypothetical protein
MNISSTSRAVVAALAVLGTTMWMGAVGGTRLEWIKIRGIGFQDKPLPVVWISTERVAEAGPGLNEFVLLGAHPFEAVAVFSRNYQCGAKPEPSELQAFGTIEVSESAEPQPRVLCVLERDSACHYLDQLLALPALSGNAREIQPVNNLARRLGCRESAAQ